MRENIGRTDHRAKVIRSQRGLVSLGCLVLILLIVGLYLATPPQTDPAAIDAGYKDGQPIADAVRRFTKETGAAPSSLEALIPRYLAEPPEGFDRFQFSVGALAAPGPWILTFWENNKMFSFVPGREGLWQTGDYDENYPPKRWTRIR